MALTPEEEIEILELEALSQSTKPSGGIGGQVSAFSRSGLGSALEAGGLTGGAMLGAQAGAALGPWGAGIGGALGGLGGWMLGGRTREHLAPTGYVTSSAEELPPEQRAAGFAGEVMGGGLPMAGLPFAAAAKTPQALQQAAMPSFIRNIVQTAQRQPGTFAATEMLGLGGAAGGEAAAETLAPGNTALRTGAGVVGGVAAPGKALAYGGPLASQTVGRMRRAVSPAGREARAGQVLQETAEALGEDPKVLAKQLRESKSGVTPAQATGSPTLAMFERKVIRDNPLVGEQTQRDAKQALQDIQGQLGQMAIPGDQQALKKLAQARSRYFNAVIRGNVEEATTKAEKASQNIAPGDVDAKIDISRRGGELMDDAVRSSRQIESELWGKVPQDQRFRVSPDTEGGLISTYNRLREQRLPIADELPEVLESNIKNIIQKEGSTTSGDLIRLRKRMLSKMREARANNKYDDARAYGEAAESILNDLDSGLAGAGLEAYDTARGFSREFNDVFSRTFAARTRETRPTGEASLPPELLFKRAFAAGDEVADVRFEQLQDSADFLRNKGLGGEDISQEMTQLQGDFLRATASKAIDPTTGRLSVNQTAKFLRNNDSLLKRFPEIKKTLNRAMTSEQARSQIERQMKQATTAVEKRTAFGDLLGFENPVDAIISAERDVKSGVKRLSGMAKLAKRGGFNEVEGMRSAVFQGVLQQARTSDGGIDFSKLDNLLTDSKAINVMAREGIVSPADIKAGKKLIREAKNIQTAIDTGRAIDQVIDSPNALIDLMERIQGASFAQALSNLSPSMAGAHPLIIGQAGSRFSRDLLQKIPGVKLEETFRRAATDKEFAAMLLEKPRTEKARIKTASQIHSYLLQNGLLEESEIGSESMGRGDETEPQR